jgi:hypothetical protein
VVGTVCRKLHVMGDQDHGPPFVGQGLDDADDLLLQLRVKGRGRLVKEKRAGFHAQGARNRGALLLAAGQLGGPGVGLVGDADLGKILARLHLNLFRVAFQDSDRRLHHVLQDGEMGPEVELLEDHRQVGADAGDLLTIGGVAVQALAFPVHGLTLEVDFALLAVLQQVATAQKGGFPRPRGPDQRDDLAARSDKVDAFQHLKRAETFVQVSNLDDRGVCSAGAVQVWHKVRCGSGCWVSRTEILQQCNVQLSVIRGAMRRCD